MPTIDHDRRDDVLGRTECLQLLATARIGRLAFTAAALPAIQPVWLSLGHEEVLVRALHGTGLVDAVRDAVVALEADDYEVQSRARWAVTVIGHARVLDGPVAVPTSDTTLIAVQIGLLQGWRTTRPK